MRLSSVPPITGSSLCAGTINAIPGRKPLLQSRRPAARGAPPHRPPPPAAAPPLSRSPPPPPPPQIDPPPTPNGGESRRGHPRPDARRQRDAGPRDCIEEKNPKPPRRGEGDGGVADASR